jgi:hypothetical protein
MKISQLYGEVDNLSSFTHPTLGKTTYMSDEKLVELATKIVSKIERSEYRSVVVCETGSRPLAMVCEKLLRERDVDVNWTYMKFARENKGKLSDMILYYLSLEERGEILDGRTRGNVIEELCGLVDRSSFDVVEMPLHQLLEKISSGAFIEGGVLRDKIVAALEGTKIARVLNGPFLFFDEYIDSGTTLQRALMHFGYFCKRVEFKTLSYYIYVDDYKKFDCVFYSLFDNSSRKEYFEIGTYRFENRVDLIGYFYNIDESGYKKISLEDVRGMVSCEGEMSDFFNEVSRVIDENLVMEFKNCFEVDCVKNYVGHEHLVRQLIVALEREVNGKGVVYDFLWRLADMYGPMWSPMPKENHLDFFAGIDKFEKMELNGWESLLEEYRKVRGSIVSEIVDVCLDRQRDWVRGLSV